MLKKFRKRSGIYRINDNIANLQIRVSFQHINSLLKLPKFDIDKILTENYQSETATFATSTSDSIRPTTSVPDAIEKNYDVKTIINIKWQEKILSPFETEFFKDATNCTTDIQKKYHQLLLQRPIEALRDGDSNKKRNKRGKAGTSAKLKGSIIFTYVNNDNFIAPDDDEAEQKGGSLKNLIVEVMYVYAALNPDTQLVSMKWYPSEKILHVYPDFVNFSGNPYFIEIDTDYCHLYAYGIENISKSRQIVGVSNYLQVSDLPPQWKEGDKLSKTFDMPKKHFQRISIIFEIREAHGFEYDNIHVRFYTKLPEETVHEEGLLSSSTHTSSHNSSSAGTWNFGYSWQLVFLFKEDFAMDQLCHLYFEVISIDSWERERIEGYSHLSFYLQPGTEVKHLNFIRPTEGFVGNLKRYFIGGRPKFDFESFYQGSGEGVKFLNRFQCQTKTTGQLVVSCSRFTQRNPELLRPYTARTIGMTLDDIMRAYREARRRLEAVVLD